jgi:hypothetical protein
MKPLQDKLDGAFPAVLILAMAFGLSLPAAAQVGAGTLEPYPGSRSPLQSPAEATVYYQLPQNKLKEAIPALKGLRYDDSQERLASILSQVAETIANVLPRLPNLVSREDIYHFQSSGDPSASGGIANSQPWNREFRYLILSHHNPNGSTTLEELRTDSKGRPAESAGAFTSPSGYGFAYQWLFFSAANQPEFRFRYLGEQDKDGRKTFVLAFAQDPHKVTNPAFFQSGTKVAPFFYQGVLWIDQATFEIVQLRTDLLAPLPDLHLRQMTTQLTFRAVPIHGYSAVFWLPSEVNISTDQGTGAVEENHRYSDYHLFRSESKIVTAP